MVQYTKENPERIRELQQMYTDWPFFRKCKCFSFSLHCSCWCREVTHTVVMPLVASHCILEVSFFLLGFFVGECTDVIRIVGTTQLRHGESFL
jgi:hypothetical protein